MSNVPDWVTWVFSGCGVAAVAGIVKFFNNKKSETNKNTNINTVNVTVEKEFSSEDQKDAEEIDKLRLTTKILFVDDDNKFRVISILKKSGWNNTKLVKDIADINAHDVKDTDIFFIDIQGVGKKMEFSDEGLGLAEALKRKYPEKKLVIYSAETSSIHPAMGLADGCLPKNADPYQFEQLVEELAKKSPNVD